MPKVSVVIPIFGVEKFIARCARSLLEQTLDDMEYIFVDDCTKDNSITILENVIKEYPNRNNQVVILHHVKNKGLSYARETGIKAASGEYIAHCDSDDWVSYDMYESLYVEAKRNNYDFIKSGRINTDGNNILGEEYVYSDEGKTDQTSIIKYLLLQKGWNSIWNILVKRSVYERAKIQYTNDAMLEDYVIVTQLLLNSEKVGILNRCFYYYYHNPRSICNVPDVISTVRRSEQAERNITLIRSFVQEKYGKKFLKEEESLLFIPRRILIPIMNDFGNFTYWNKITPRITWKVLCNSYISLSHKLWYMECVLLIRPVIEKWRRHAFIRKVRTQLPL